jgi:hypothetical protein
MSSRELINLIEGMPFDSWFKGVVREDMEELIGDATVATLDEVRQQTEALLRGERKVTAVVIETDMDGDPGDEEQKVRKRRADQA